MRVDVFPEHVTPAPGQPVVPNTVGLTTVRNARFLFGAAGTWTPGSTLLLRWVDDNGVASSPDEIIGLDNVGITPVPEPSSLLCLSAVGVLAGARVIRKRFRMDEAMARESYVAVAEAFSRDGRIPPDGVENLLDLEKKDGFIAKTVTVDQVVDFSVGEELLKELGR